ncbi:7,8-didemethyl-8-hydroxy-5-deazariboflavin synthase subunit 1 / 7,8-didemethyl-8-hydroxy-5-deazariboflavin synthase subunit 2 [[Actinomadura] parvosata subsp. kistnae]|uniref:FO synthase n=1 Tax=[Actinomadura] parvosata subsp. kistnae TaxID=1909395 RepID=A0A1V0A8V9_9ACTN|nr:bifunctional FO biosynthesis protein CofGH [Nonomuraea sp. ATCC 55076]AQZ66609.1 7,8-didemethyl-8-hydroxy-5-deazariboflavin synthase [Nonomuraea sp. ATCC 55076]SPL95303.1 7,8-didemethyl-8-hydroxy-5-deazariboflavin synthase subunit 1 / 7,8-didemethyl-8-hydroxy-5-deazariboflavin synthase subunit 2 [Actinomadura parvosata subsp. kistnae]
MSSDSALRRALARARDGKTLDVTEATVLLHARDGHLDTLLDHASRVRDAGLRAAGREGIITYSRKVFIPLTRLCRDRCGYCTFATAPHKLPAPFLSPDEVLEIARQGAAMGCKEALFTLGDRPEDRWHQAREWLDAHGYDDTLSYVRAMAIRVLEETGLLPHLNPGVLSWRDFQRLKPVAPSMGMMLETTSRRLFEEKGQPHYGSPDKDPAVRLRVLEDAGRTNVPFTTGILIGIGETVEDRAESIFAIRKVAREYGGIQEVIVQNFRAKPDTAMRGLPDADLQELAATIAVARLVLGPRVRLQAPPNLVDSEYELMIRAGIDDWGGVSPLTPDHVNPERPWPQIDDLAARTGEAGFRLRERLTIYPEYVLAGEPWLDPRLIAHVSALADPETGLAREDAVLEGRPWQEPDGGFAASGRVDLHVEVDTTGRTNDRRDDFDHVYGDWDALRERLGTVAATTPSDVRQALRRAEADPAGLTDAEAVALLGAEGEALDELAAIADALRKEAVGDDVTYVVNRNINFTNVCYTGCRFCAFAQRRTDADAYTLSVEQVADRAEEAWAAGATEVCMQGGIHPDLPGTAYFDIARAVKARTPGMHVHAFSPMEVINGASRTNLSIRDWLEAAKEAGVDSLPGTAAEILDDDVRWVLTKGKLPAKEWIEVITTAHRVGIPTTSTMMYGHVDNHLHWVRHIKLIRGLQEETGGFSEFVLLPFVHTSAPIYLAGVARPGPTAQENRAVHALARILLHGAIGNIQCSWVKLQDDLCRQVLQGGVNDLGGTLMEETISRMAGSENGSYKTISELRAMVEVTGRPVRQRTTEYGVPSEERLAASAASDGVCQSVRRVLPLA